MDWESNTRRIVIDGRAALERTSQSLERSNQIASETEVIGTEVISELGSQRETLLRTKDRLINAQDELDQTRSIVRRMQRNVFYNKLILIVIIIIEAIILALLLYLKFFSK